METKTHFGNLVIRAHSEVIKIELTHIGETLHIKPEHLMRKSIMDHLFQSGWIKQMGITETHSYARYPTLFKLWASSYHHSKFPKAWKKFEAFVKGIDTTYETDLLHFLHTDLVGDSTDDKIEPTSQEEPVFYCMKPLRRWFVVPKGLEKILREANDVKCRKYIVNLRNNKPDGVYYAANWAVYNRETKPIKYSIREEAYDAYWRLFRDLVQGYLKNPAYRYMHADMFKYLMTYEPKPFSIYEKENAEHLDDNNGDQHQDGFEKPKVLVARVTELKDTVDAIMSGKKPETTTVTFEISPYIYEEDDPRREPTSTEKWITPSSLTKGVLSADKAKDMPKINIDEDGPDLMEDELTSTEEVDEDDTTYYDGVQKDPNRMVTTPVLKLPLEE